MVERVLSREPGRVLQVRWLFAATICLVAWTSGGTAWATLVPTAVLLAQGLFVHLLPRRTLHGARFLETLVLADTLLASFALAGSGAGDPRLLGAFFFAVLVAALARDLWHSLGACTAVIAVYLALAGVFDGRAGMSAAILLRLPFLYAVNLYVAELVTHVSRNADDAFSARRESRELRALLEISDAVTGTLDLRRVMSLIVQRVGEMVQARSCSILLVNEKVNNCFVMAASDAPDVDMLEVDLQKYPEVRRAVETREPVLIRDVEHDPLVAPVREILMAKGYRSVLVLPLVFGREVLGTLFLRATRTAPFLPGEIRFCRVAAAASANALKNALLYRDVAMEAARHRTTGQTLRRVLDCSPDMILATDAEGRITEFNRGAERLTGRRVADVLGRPVRDVLGTDAPSGDTVLHPDDHTEVAVSLVSAPLVGAADEAAGRVWIGRDVTRLRQAEQSLIQAERLSSIGEVVAGVAHELNNPLSAVIGYAQLLSRSLSGDKTERDLGRIVQSARRCQKIVLNLLSFARKHPPEKKLQDLNDCIRSVVDLKGYQLRSSGVEVHLNLDPALPHTSFDYHQVEQVIVNLVNNAEQAMVSAGRPGSIRISTRAVGDMILLEVEDGGPGVPPEIRDRIFDPFFTTKEAGEGTGLGLAVSYGIIQEHGGRIELGEGESGRGARFRIYLPRAEGPAPEPEREPASGEPAGNPLRGCRILVAEDEPALRELFARILKEDGADVTLVPDGQEAWERIASAEYDLIVTDLRMPRLDGRRLYEKVAEERPELLRRIVFATGDLVRQETVRFLEGLPNRILSKPFEVETVRHVLGQAVRALVTG